VLQQRESNLGLIACAVVRCAGGGGAAAECADEGLDDPGEVVGRAGWTWRRGALVEGLILEPGSRYHLRVISIPAGIPELTEISLRF
jgi:hypothetical protein